MSKRVLFYDLFICKYFETTFEAVMKAEARLSESLNAGETIHVQDFYNYLGVDDLDFDSVFECDEDCVWAGFDHTLVNHDRNLECVVLSPPFKMRDGRVLVYSQMPTETCLPY